MAEFGEQAVDPVSKEKFLGHFSPPLAHVSREEAKADITEYIEIFYHRQRHHSKLDNLSPVVFAQQARIQQMRV